MNDEEIRNLRFAILWSAELATIARRAVVTLAGQGTDEEAITAAVATQLSTLMPLTPRDEMVAASVLSLVALHGFPKGDLDA